MSMDSLVGVVLSTFSPGEIMTGCCLHKSNIMLSFGVYCQFAENVQPWNGVAPWMQAAILVGSLGNLSGGTIIRHQWVALPMPPAVIDCVNLLDWREPAMLTFTDWQGHDIGDSNPQDANSVEILDDDLIIIHPAMKIPGVDTTKDPAEIAGVDPDFDIEPTGTGVDMDTNAWAMDTNVLVDNNAIATDGLKRQDPTEGAAAVLTSEPTISPKKAKSPAKKNAPPKMGMAAQILVQGKHLRKMSQV
jgi:hypothetical protein